MPEHRSPIERVVDAAREMNGWLGLLGSYCCAGRSYRRFDDAKIRAARAEEPPEGASSEETDSTSPPQRELDEVTGA
jgi:hypothetical protein